MKLGILNPAPIGANLTKWGDYHFGQSLETSLKRIGVQVEQRYWPEWDNLGAVDACLTLRGKRARRPKANCLNLVWVISHPASVSTNELNCYDHVFTASETHLKFLDGRVSTSVSVLRQCTDDKLFFCNQDIQVDLQRRRTVSFVANSRGINRPILSTMLKAGVGVSLFGRQWNDVGLGSLVQSQFVENNKLPDVYRAARVSLNDHWIDMKHFGFINNRIFDCLACGSPIISDSFPELKAVCGDSILYLDEMSELGDILEEFSFDYERVLRRVREFWAATGYQYTFDRRAQDIVATIGECCRRGRPSGQTWEDTPSKSDTVEQVNKILTTLRGELKGAPLQVLHLFPDEELRFFISGLDDVDYVTAGIGTGPWLVDVSEGVDLFKKARFQLILIGESDYVSGGLLSGLEPLKAPAGTITRVSKLSAANYAMSQLR